MACSLIWSAGLFSAAPLEAAEVTRVTSGGDRLGERFDLDLAVEWTHEQRSAQVRRERGDQSTGGRIEIDDELTYQQSRDVLQVGAVVGIFRDLSLFINAPIVLSDTRTLSFDRSGCVAGGVSPCVNENNATLLRDGIVPRTATGFGLDVPHDRPFAAGSQTVFAGPKRSGIESLGLGVRYAVTSQARDTVMPTWIVGIESRLAVSKDMRFDPANPKANAAAGLGYHQIVLSTAFSRRLSDIDPYVSGWMMFPIPTSDSIYSRSPLGDGAHARPQRRAGAEAGAEVVVWENTLAHQRINLEARGRLELRFAGLAASEMWEPLSGATTCPGQMATCRGGIDRDLTKDGIVDPNPGVVGSPAYGLFGGDVGLAAQVGRHVRFRTLFGMTFEQARTLTDGRSENPTYDVPGRRWRIEDGRSWHLIVDAGLMF